MVVVQNFDPPWDSMITTDSRSSDVSIDSGAVPDYSATTLGIYVSLNHADFGSHSSPLPVVRRLVPGGPADIDGRLMLGDFILAVDSVPVTTMNFVQMMRGRDIVGSIVRLSVLRRQHSTSCEDHNGGNRLEIDLIRESYESVNDKEGLFEALYDLQALFNHPPADGTCGAPDAAACPLAVAAAQKLSAAVGLARCVEQARLHRKRRALLQGRSPPPPAPADISPPHNLYAPRLQWLAGSDPGPPGLVGHGGGTPGTAYNSTHAALSSAAFRVHCHKVCPDGTARAIRLDPARHTVRSAAALSSAAPPSA